MTHNPDDLVKTCRKLESGLRLGQEGLHACQVGPFSSPLYWSAEELQRVPVSKEAIIEKRRQLFEQLNDDHSDIACKTCLMVETKPFREVDFTKLGQIDLAATTLCNLRCSFCGYTTRDSFSPAPYNALPILNLFQKEDVLWNSAVDFNGGEPALLEDLEDYLTLFKSRGIRVFLYTNAVQFRQAIYDGLVDGSIRWVCSSLDAGTPSTFKTIKRRDHFLRVLENLTRYAHAGRLGKGELAVKYIFCDGNCGEDDVVGFAYAMLAIRPQKIWLTFDFEPLAGLPGNSPDFGDMDYTPHVRAYAQLFATMCKHGMTPGHFVENHLGNISLHGKLLQEAVLARIQRLDPSPQPHLQLGPDEAPEALARHGTFQTGPLRISHPCSPTPISTLRGKRIVIAPACQLSLGLLNDPEIRAAEILCWADRDSTLQGKQIAGIPVRPYSDIPSLEADYALVACHPQTRVQITRTLAQIATPTTRIIVYTDKKESE